MLGRKIVKRTAEKRADFKAFYSTLSMEEKEYVENGLKLLLKKAVVNIDFLDEVISCCRPLNTVFGSRLSDYRLNLERSLCPTEPQALRLITFARCPKQQFVNAHSCK